MVLIAGYIARQYGLPPPAPKIAGIDLGTTFSSIGLCSSDHIYLYFSYGYVCSTFIYFYIH